MKMSPDDKIKKDNALGLFKNPSTRPVVLMTGAILVGAIVLGAMTLGKTADEVQTGAQVDKIDSVQHVPGASSDTAHNDLQRQENERRAAEAARLGRTNMPVITGDTSVNSPLVVPALNQPPAQQPPQTEPPPYNPQGTPAPVTQTRAPEVPVAPAAASKTMNDQIAAYLSLWGPRQNEFQEYKYNGSRDITAERAPSGVNQQVGPQTPLVSTASEESKIRYVRAGTMIPAVLIIPLNSDSPGPVLAQVSSGPLAGARLIGQMQKNGDSIMVAFTTITKPGWPDTYSVSAMGLDLKSSSALASDVNHHYFQRYAGMLVGTYLSGYGQAMRQTGNSTVITPGGIIVDNPTLSTKQIQRSAAGNVLNGVGSEIKGRSNRETTIKVQGKNGQPYPIKILFMSNF